MSRAWHSLYLPFDDARAAADALVGALTACGYERYDPFPGGTGLAPAWKQRVRHFVAPSRSGWVRILGEPEPAALPLLAAALGVPLLHAWLVDDESGLTVWTAAGRDDSPAAFAAWLRDGCTPDVFQRALAGQGPAPAAPKAADSLGVPLPDDVQALADLVDMDQAGQMMARLTRSLFGRLGDRADAMQEEARAMLSGEPIWETAAGRRLRAAVACLRVPEDWQQPDEGDLRAAYQVARSRKHNPRGLRLPGDDAALARVPDALAYLPVYAGRRG